MVSKTLVQKLASTAVVVIVVGAIVKAVKPYAPAVIARWLPF